MKPFEPVKKLTDEEINEALRMGEEIVNRRLEKDNVNHPSHYTSGKVECIDAIESAIIGLSGMDAMCTGNAIKYLWRWKQKNGREDLRKAKWYIDRILVSEDEK